MLVINDADRNASASQAANNPQSWVFPSNNDSSHSPWAHSRRPSDVFIALSPTSPKIVDQLPGCELRTRHEIEQRPEVPSGCSTDEVGSTHGRAETARY